VVDRGFRDAVETMSQLGFNVEMPDFLKGKKQLATKDANHARSVTKVRWVIEAGMRQGGTSVLLYFLVLLGTSRYFLVLLVTSSYFFLFLINPLLLSS
jgi:hypothetical protein